MTGNDDKVKLRGVIFRCTIRAGHGSFAIIVSDEDREHPTAKENEERMVLVVVRFGGAEWGDQKSQEKLDGRNDKGNEMAPLMRSNIKRLCKLGNEMIFHGQFAKQDASDGGEPKAQAKTTKDKESSTNNDWQSWNRFIVDYYPPNANTSSEKSISNVEVCQELKWDSNQCQTVRSKYFAPPPNKQKQKQQQKRTKQSSEAEGTYNDLAEESKKRRHGGGIGKRKQGEIVSDFLLFMLSTSSHEEKDDEAEMMPTAAELGAKNDQSTFDDNDLIQCGSRPDGHPFMKRLVPLHSTLASSDASLIASRNATVAKMIRQVKGPTRENDIEHGGNTPTLPRGGIIDAAGGAGHVSLALALRGVHSTVVDPRSNVGKLPGRDRKVLKKSKKESFNAYRAWFGQRPTGVDSFFREGNITSTNASDGHLEHNQSSVSDNNTSIDPTTLPICSMCSEDNLLANCNAIVALHPDEATGVIVETAVKHEIPFVVVPCCVFSRLFPDRIKPTVAGTEGENHANAIVSTYYDLIDWLVAKHPAIKVTRLPFDGANLAVWATFK